MAWGIAWWGGLGAVALLVGFCGYVFEQAWVDSGLD